RGDPGRAARARGGIPRGDAPRSAGGPAGGRDRQPHTPSRMNAVAVAPAPRRARLVLSPDDNVVLAARATIRFHLRVFSAVEEDARAGEVEAVHQPRVATRRPRAALHLLGPPPPARLAAAP